MDKIKLVWLSGLKTEEEKASFKQALLSRVDLWDKMREIIEDKLESKEMHYKDYDNASWAYKQAHANGYKEALTEIYDLLP